MVTAAGQVQTIKVHWTESDVLPLRYTTICKIRQLNTELLYISMTLSVTDLLTLPCVGSDNSAGSNNICREEADTATTQSDHWASNCHHRLATSHVQTSDRSEHVSRFSHVLFHLYQLSCCCTWIALCFLGFIKQTLFKYKRVQLIKVLF